MPWVQTLFDPVPEGKGCEDYSEFLICLHVWTASVPVSEDRN